MLSVPLADQQRLDGVMNVAGGDSYHIGLQCEAAVQ